MIKKIISRVTRPGIAVRLTGYFIVFGILIGYLSFIMFITIITHTYIRLAASTFASVIQEIAGADNADFVPNIINKKNDELANLIHLTDKILSKNETKAQFSFYRLEKAWQPWKRIYLDANEYFKMEDVSPETHVDLQETLHKKIKKSSNFYYGKKDRISMMVLLSPEDSPVHYVASFSANREGIDGFMRRNREYLCLFALILILVSALLGKFFAYRFARPIKTLSREASMAAGGNRDVRFSVKRRDEIGILSESLNVMNAKIRGDMAEIQRHLKAMETMNKIDKAVLSSISRKDLLDRVVAIVSSLFDSSAIAMTIRNNEKKGFDILSFYQGGGKGVLKQDPFISDKSIGEEFLPLAQKVSQRIMRSSEQAPRFTREIMDICTGSLINVPIFIADRYLGSLVMTKADMEGFSPEEVATIQMIADQIGVALRSVRSFEEKENLLLGILLALTKSIDAKSKWTAGHSERVAHLSEDMALRFNFDEKSLRTLTFSAILHDIGKIAVPEIILDKPARLTEDEYDVVKQHPSIGAEIIYDIPSYENIVPGILYHHEHWDGSGYPLSLRGEEIPLNARIITLADVYDAITAERPYRKGMTRDDALDFIRGNSEKLFDPKLVGEFIEVIYEEEIRHGKE